MLTVDSRQEWSWIFSHHVGRSYYYYKNFNMHEVICFESSQPFFFWEPKMRIMPPTRVLNGALIMSTTAPHRRVYDGDFNPRRYYGKEWLPPPYKTHYGRLSPLKPKKPVIVINNKYSVEWRMQPFNFIPVNMLRRIIETFSDDYEIYYMRYQGAAHKNEQGYYDDVVSLNLGEYEILERDYPHVTTIYDVINEHGYDFNTAQMMMLSKADHVLSVNGGNGILSSYFGKDVVMYGHPDCKSTKRTIWRTDSWLKHLSGANIFGYVDEEELMNVVKQRWL